MKHTARCLLLGAALLTGWPALAQYSWIDNTGRRVFSDQPPPADIAQKNVLSKTATPVTAEVPAAPASAASGQDPALEAKKKASEAAAAAKQTQEEQKLAAQRADNCQRAQANLAGLQSGMRIAQFDTQGQRSYMSDEQRAAEVERMQGIMASNCR